VLRVIMSFLVRNSLLEFPSWKVREVRFTTRNRNKDKALVIIKRLNRKSS